MNAEPGWYDAGVAGAQRWWDGTQWTDHQRAVPQQIQPQATQIQPQASQPQQHAVQPQQQYAAPVAQRAPMGWFPVVGTADVRWWDGSGWTPHRLRDGKPRPDAYATEPASTSVTLGIVFIVLAIVQLNNYRLSGQSFLALTPVLFSITGIIWLIGGIRVSQLKKLAAPSTAPVFDPVTRPLPGEAEGPDAGWFPVSGQVTRWWTGTRWSEYISQKVGVRPTHSGARAYRLSMALAWVFAGLGVLGMLIGFTLMATMPAWAGAVILVPSVIVVIVGAILLPVVYSRRYTMILPPKAPPLR